MNELQLLRAQYPRVSDILSKQTIAVMQKIPIDKLANATIRGIKVHNYCLAYAAGLFLSEIEPPYNPYVDTFIEWYDQNVKTQIHNSVRLYDDVKKFSGEFDLIVEMKTGERALIDIKTSCTSSKTWPLQLSAYNHLCTVNDYKVDRIFNLHLKKKYTKKSQDICVEDDLPLEVQAKIMDYPDIEHYWEIFNDALTCYDYFDRKGVKTCSSQ